MGTALTGLEIKDTYDGLVKITDNGPLSGTLKALSDGLGNDSTLSLSTTAASIAGTLAVTGNATFDTSTLFVDATNNRVGVGNAAPAYKLDITANNNASIAIAESSDDPFIWLDRSDGGSSRLAWRLRENSLRSLIFETGSSASKYGQTFTEAIRITSAGNVGIGTSAPTGKLEVNGAMRTTRSGVASQYIEVDGGDAAGGFITMVGAAKTLTIRNNSTSSSDVLFDQAVATRFTFAQAGTQILRIDADGVKFGTDSAAANALDDYEEGTWTMGISFGGASVGVTYSINTGTYTKIGRQVTLNGYLQLTSKGSSTGNAAITGLPFTIPNLNQSFSAASLWFAAIQFTNQFQGYGLPNTTTIDLREITILGIESSLTNAEFANDSRIIFSLTYSV